MANAYELMESDPELLERCVAYVLGAPEAEDATDYIREGMDLATILREALGIEEE